MLVYQRDRSPAVEIGPFKLGDGNFVIMAGPCAIESKLQVDLTAQTLGELHIPVFRAGAFKPRTSPYEFRGLGEEGLKILADVRKNTGMSIVTEVMDSQDVELVSRYADILQIGSRNMQNYRLLEAVGETQHPVVLKRGLAATVEEWLYAAEYIMAKGNEKVILCERGIRTFEKYTRNTLDLGAVVAVKELSNLPVIVDPSHGSGKSSMVAPLARAAMAAGADGLLIEVHIDPEKALCDGKQSLTPVQMKELMKELNALSKAMGKEIVNNN